MFSEEDLVWSAPEVLIDSENINWQAADIYSFGIIVSEIINGGRAYSDSDLTYEGTLVNILLLLTWNVVLKSLQCRRIFSSIVKFLV